MISAIKIEIEGICSSIYQIEERIGEFKDRGYSKHIVEGEKRKSRNEESIQELLNSTKRANIWITEVQEVLEKAKGV